LSPAIALKPLTEHTTRFVDDGLDAVVFTGDKGALLRTGNFLQSVKWAKLRGGRGLPSNFTFHDLRHTGNTMASETGTNISRTDEA
jgi:integrase